jgi:hypothetical protein
MNVSNPTSSPDPARPQNPRSGGGGNVVHVQASDYIHLLGVTIKGLTGVRRRPQETLKVGARAVEGASTTLAVGSGG